MQKSKIALRKSDRKSGFLVNIKAHFSKYWQLLVDSTVENSNTTQGIGRNKGPTPRVNASRPTQTVSLEKANMTPLTSN